MMHQSACPCEQPTCPADSGFFYVSTINNGEYRLLLGPFAMHEDAIHAVPIGERLAQIDPRAHWYAYGTCRTESDLTDKVLFRPCPDCGEVKFIRQTCGCRGFRA